jgi:CheY-like chemotaxis protein
MDGRGTMLVLGVMVPRLPRVVSGGTMTVRAILLVEDNPDEVQLVCEALASVDAAIPVQVAPSIESAWALLQAADGAGLPALVVTDHHLPDGHGQDLIARLRGCPVRSHLPVVMVSGDAARPADLAQVSWFAKPDTWSGWCSLARELAKRTGR